MKKFELHEMMARLMVDFDDPSLNAILNFNPPIESVERVSWLAEKFRDDALNREEHFEFQSALGFNSCLTAMYSNARRMLNDRPERVRDWLLSQLNDESLKQAIRLEEADRFLGEQLAEGLDGIELASQDDELAFLIEARVHERSDDRDGVRERMADRIKSMNAVELLRLRKLYALVESRRLLNELSEVNE